MDEANIIVNYRAVHVHVEHRSDEEPGGDLTGKFAQPGREREGQNGNLGFAEAMITFLIFLLEVMNLLLIVFSRSNFSFIVWCR